MFLRKPALTAFAAVALTLLAYTPSLNGPFFTDDHAYVVANPVLRAMPIDKPWRFFYTRTNPFEFLPVRDLSFRIDMALFENEPLGYHLHNLFLYALGCFFVWLAGFAISKVVLRSRWDDDIVLRNQCAWIATATVALFVAHPAHVESVAWISGRKDLLSGLFAAVSLWLFASAIERTGHIKLFRAGSCLFFLLAVLSKATVLPLALVTFLLGMSSRDRERSTYHRAKNALLAALPLLAVAAGALTLHVLVGTQTEVLKEAPFGLDETGGPSAAVPLKILGYLTRIALLPVGLRLIYDLGEPGWVSVAAYLLGSIVVVGTATALWILVKRRSLVALGVAAFTLFCLPFLQLVPFKTWSLASERFLYLPLLGFALAFAALLAQQKPRIAVGSVSVVFALLLGATFARSRTWASTDSLIIENQRRSPHQHLAVEFYIDTLVNAHRYEEATEAAQRVRNDRARQVLERYVQARAAVDRGDLTAAAPLVHWLSVTPKWDSRIFDLQIANLALEVGMTEQAATVYRSVLEQRPFEVTLRYNLGLALKQLGQKEEAAKEIRSAIDGGFRPAGAWNNLGLLYRDLGRYSEAEQAFLEGLENEPDHWHAAYNLARMYLSQARVSDARRWLIEARRHARDAGDDTSAVDAILEQMDSEIPENR